MKKIFIIIICFVSCKSLKQVEKTDNSTEQTEIVRKTTYRKADTLTINIPNVRYKDTTITRINYETKKVLRVEYDKQGNQKIDCESAEIKELTETIKKLVQKDIKEEEIKKKEFSPQRLVYALVAVCVCIIVLVFIHYLF